MNHLIKFCLLSLGLLLSACVYRAPVQQGNIISEEWVARLQPGMTKEEVRYRLGDPILNNTIDRDHWWYVSSYQPQHGKIRQQHVVITFKDDRVVQVEKAL